MEKIISQLGLKVFVENKNIENLKNILSVWKLIMRSYVKLKELAILSSNFGEKHETKWKTSSIKVKYFTLKDLFIDY